MMKPKSGTELSEMIRAAQGPLCIQGGATRGLSVDGDVIETSGLEGVTLYEPGALTLVAGAGTTLSEVETLLAGEGQRLAFEPRRLNALLGTSGDTTLGGIVATNSAGPARIALGNCADHLLGVRFVNGAGEIVKNGGRVMKNVTGYDLVKLMAGSHGTLGVLSEVSLKVLPKPETEATLAITGQTAEAAQEMMARALASPFEVTGAVHIPGGETLLRIEGFEASVSYRAGKLSDLTGAELALQGEASRTRWAELRDLSMFAGGDADIWRLRLKPSDGPKALARLQPGKALMDMAGGEIWLEHAPGDDLRNQLTDLNCDAQLIRGQGAPRFQPQSPALTKIQSGLRAQFDPRGILNSGLMG